MKNLKKALSLVLSAAMMVGMMAVGTGAAYADVTAEHNEEAIAVMQAAGIMEGDGNGFNPDNKVTRHEMAVVMANMLDLKVEDFSGAETPFTDVAAWAAPYVAACYADGIMAGTSATTFGGDIKVTAAQAALMMMKALGYFQFQPDFGEDWQLATIKQASKIDLFDGMNVGATTELTRNDVAKLALNALESDVVYYTGSQGTNITLSDGTSILTGYTIQYWSETDTNGEDYTNDASYSGNTADDAYLQLVEKLFDSTLVKFKSADDFGRAATEWKYELDGLGKYAHEADVVYEGKVTKATLYNLIGKDMYNDLTASPAAATLNVTVDGAPVSSPVVGNYFAKNNTAAAGVSGNGTVTEIYVDGETNTIDIVMINTYVVQAQADYSAQRDDVKVAFPSNTDNIATSISLNSYTLSGEDFDIKDVKEDDYLIITAAKNGAGYDVKSIKPATVVTGTVGSYKTNSNVVLDGTKYEYVANAATGTKTAAYAVDEDAKVVTNGNGVIYFVDELTVAADQYVFITGAAYENNFNEDIIAKAVFLDGSKEVIALADKFSDGTTPVTTSAIGWSAYSVDSDGVYTLTDISSLEDAGTITSSTDMVINNAVALPGVSGKANANTIFVVVDGDDDITVYTGVTAVPTITAPATTTGVVFETVVKNGVVKYVFIDACDGVIDTTKDSEDYIYILEADGTGKDANGDTVYFYKAIVNGEETTITTTTTGYTAERLFAEPKYNDAGYIKSMTQLTSSVMGTYNYEADSMTIDNETDEDVDFDGGVLTLGDKSYVVADDCAIYMIAMDSNIKEDGNATYELTTGISANVLKSIVAGYDVSAVYYAELDEDNGSLLTLYFKISGTSLAD